MSQKKNRIQRKAARVRHKTEVEQVFNRELGVLKRELDEALRVANIEYENALSQASAARSRARGEAYKGYDKQRDELLKKLGTLQEVKQEEAAAA